jgi:hypothetical protein
MEFKSDSTKRWTSTTAQNGANGSAITHTGNVSAFKVHPNSFSEAGKAVIPEGMLPMVQDIGQGLGVDLTDLSKLDPEQVKKAKELAAKLDEKLVAMKELAPCIMKYLSFQVSAAEFQAEVVVQAAKAKTKIDAAAARAYVAYYRYLRKAQNLEKRVNQKRQIIDAAYTAFETVQDARCNAILTGLNQQARLGAGTAAHSETLKQERQQILATRKQNLETLRHEIKTSHLRSN